MRHASSSHESWKVPGSSAWWLRGKLHEGCIKNRGDGPRNDELDQVPALSFPGIEFRRGGSVG